MVIYIILLFVLYILYKCGFYKALIECCRIDTGPEPGPRKGPEPVTDAAPEPWTITDAKKTWYQLEQEERAELEERAKNNLILLGHTRPEIVKTLSNIELIRIATRARVR